eukprot:1363232-Lingulodinium_polyedra.AAC.1
MFVNTRVIERGEVLVHTVPEEAVKTQTAEKEVFNRGIEQVLVAAVGASSMAWPYHRVGGPPTWSGAKRC